MNDLLTQLNLPAAEQRLSALKKIIEDEQFPPKVFAQFANNHIHTFYSFSPYSPTAAIYFAREAGLQTAGIMDHDSIAGAKEFIQAGKIAGMATTIGMECRVSVSGTSLEGKRINNPDQKGIAYMALHGVAHTQINCLQSAFEPLREKRNIRNRKMVEKINEIVLPYEIMINFDDDVLPISHFSLGGSITERHILFALANKIIEKIGRAGVSNFLRNEMNIELSSKQIAQMEDGENPYFNYDLLGILKSSLVERIYIPATDECMHISELSALAQQTGAVFCYAYLGDVGDSVTGDKKTQKFEDDYLPELFDVLQSFGIDGVTYMPSRNTAQQLTRIQKMCRERNITEISGEDINSPRQKFICKQLEQPQFAHLIDATWHLIERERLETERQMKKN